MSMCIRMRWLSTLKRLYYLENEYMNRVENMVNK